MDLSTDETADRDAREEAEARLSGWMQAAQRGDADAYRALLTAIQPVIRGMVRARIREADAAEDVVQNALLSIHRGRATYRPERPFGPWMRAIVRNSIVDHFRSRKRRLERESDLPVETLPDDRGAGADRSEPLAPELVAALETLPASQREAVTLIQVEGLSMAEAALRTGASVGAMKVRAHRGYRALHRALEGLRVDGAWRSSRPPPPDARHGLDASCEARSRSVVGTRTGAGAGTGEGPGRAGRDPSGGPEA